MINKLPMEIERKNANVWQSCQKVAKSLYFVILQHFFQTFATFKNTSTSKRNVKYVMKRKRIVDQILHLFATSIFCFVSRQQNRTKITQKTIMINSSIFVNYFQFPSQKLTFNKILIIKHKIDNENKNFVLVQEEKQMNSSIQKAYGQFA